MFWGRIEGTEADYYICMGVTYTDKYEFPEKRFYWASSNSFSFKAFGALCNQHVKEVDNYTEMNFSGNPGLVHIKVEPEITPEEEEAKRIADEEAANKPVNPLDSTEEEDAAAAFVPVNFTELDRLHYVVCSIENDCHIMPKGAVKMTDQHEVRNNTAYRGLS